MKLSFIKTFAIILPLFLASCNTQSYLIKVATPPTLELPPDVTGILVFNRFVPAQGDYERVQWGAYETLDTAILMAADSCAASFSAKLDSYDRYRTRMPSGERMFKHNGSELPEPLPWEGLTKIADRHYAKGIAMLESFNIEESDSVVLEAGDYTASIEYTITNGWRLYQPSRKRVLDSSVYVVKYNVKASGETAAEAKENLPDKNERLILAAKFAGEEYARMLNPGSIELKRRIYVKGHPIIEEAAGYVAEGDWGKAENKWDYNSYEAEDDDLKAMCCFNMAVLSERQGYINKALGFARKSQKLKPSKIHLELINDLLLRSYELDELYKAGKIIKNW